MEKQEIVKNLVANGAKSVKNIKVKNVTVTPMEAYVRLGLTLDKDVEGKVQNEAGEWVDDTTKVIFVSMFSVLSLLKDDEDAAFAANHLAKNPDSMMVVLSRATIDIVQQHVVAGEEYKNPWSDSADVTVFDHDVIINHLVNIKLSDFAIRKIDHLADKLMMSI